MRKSAVTILILLATVLGFFAFTHWYKVDKQEGVISWPENLGTQYVSIIDWPPQMQVLDQEYSCTEAGTETARAGRTEERVIGGHKYCVTTESEGAAGSTYNQYAYGFEKSGKMVFLTFTLRFPQCMDYDEPKQSECKNEYNNLGLDSLIDRVGQNLEIK